MKLQNVWALARRPVRSQWFRAVQTQFANSPLGFTHTGETSGRFHHGTADRPGAAVLYLTEDPVTSLFEVRAVYGSPLPDRTYVPNPTPGQGWTIVSVEVTLHAVADLTDATQTELLDTTVQELTGDWIGYIHRHPRPAPVPPYYTPVPTQQVGSALYATGVYEGLISYSSMNPTRRNLIVFPANLQPGSVLEHADARGRSHRIPPAPEPRPRRRRS